MEFKKEDLKVEVGNTAYSLYTGEKVSCDNMQSQKYRFGVYIEHIPTGKKVYTNSERSQIKNKDIAIKMLKKL